MILEIDKRQVWRLFALSVLAVVLNKLQIIVSFIHVDFTAVYRHYEGYNMTYGDLFYELSSTAGQMSNILYGAACTGFLARHIRLFIYPLFIFWFMFNLGVYDLLDTIFLNPYEVSIPKYGGFVVSVIITLISLTLSGKWQPKKTKNLQPD